MNKALIPAILLAAALPVDAGPYVGVACGFSRVLPEGSTK